MKNKNGKSEHLLTLYNSQLIDLNGPDSFALKLSHYSLIRSALLGGGDEGRRWSNFVAIPYSSSSGGCD